MIHFPLRNLFLVAETMTVGECIKIQTPNEVEYLPKGFPEWTVWRVVAAWQIEIGPYCCLQLIVDNNLFEEIEIGQMFARFFILNSNSCLIRTQQRHLCTVE